MATTTMMCSSSFERLSSGSGALVATAARSNERTDVNEMHNGLCMQVESASNIQPLTVTTTTTYQAALELMAG